MKSSITILIFAIILIVAGFVSLTPVAFALGPDGIWENTGEGGVTCNKAKGGCTICDAIIVTQNIITYLFLIAIPLAVAMIIWGGIVLMTAAGSEERVRKGRDIITKAVIGLLIVFAAWIIVNTVINFLAREPNFPWHTVTCK